MTGKDNDERYNEEMKVKEGGGAMVRKVEREGEMVQDSTTQKNVSRHHQQKDINLVYEF